MKLKLLFLLFILLILPVYSIECSQENLPKINLKLVEELYESVPYYNDVNNDNLSILTYIEVDSKFKSFKLIDDNINFTPSFKADLGIHKLLFVAVDSSDCYNAKLVEFNVFDKPEIIPLEPSSNNIILEEGNNLLFVVNIEDIDYDVTKYSWYVNEILQNSTNKERFTFVSNYNSTGRYNVSLLVVDKKGLNDTYNWNIRVTNFNRLPYLFSDIPDYAVKSGDSLVTNSMNDYFGDPDGDNLDFIFKITDSNGNEIDIKAFLNENNELVAKIPKNIGNIILIRAVAIDAFNAQVSSNAFIVHIIENLDAIDITLIETHVCGDMICGGNETCDNCGIDCGPCLEGQTKCIHNWECTKWSDCIAPGLTIRGCIDNNHCFDISENPSLVETCKIVETCFDNIKSIFEEKVDCGGFCDSCPTCFDNIINQGEKGIDCGGPCLNPCPTCDDNLQNQFESDIDCGGKCGACSDSKNCFSWKDCESRVCSLGICQIPTCFDGMKNQDEVGVDCEGTCNITCPTCYDNIKNQNEEKTDCGGFCDSCPTCFDNIKNQGEKYTDCGDSCRNCVWSDFNSAHPKQSLSIIISIIVFTSIILLSLAYYFINSKIKNSTLDRLIFFNKWRFKSTIFENIGNDIDKLNNNLLEILKDKKSNIELRVKTKNLLSNFIIDQLKLDIHDDKKTTFQKINEKELGFPLNRIVLLFVKLSKEISTHDYYTEPELTSKLIRIVRILKEIKKDV